MSLVALLLALLSVASCTRVPERGLYWDVAPYDKSVDPQSVREIHIVFSNHLDVGFNSRAWCDGGAYKGCTGPNMTRDGQLCRPWSYSVIQANMDTFIPRAAVMARALRNTSTPFKYMTQPFVVDFLLDCEHSGLVDWRPGTQGAPLLTCPNASTIAMFKEAVQAGEIWWHAFPHNPMPGLYEASLFNASLRMAARQAELLGVRQPTTYSQRDETGMTRAIVPLLVASGVGMISLGAGGSAGGHAAIPGLFVWRDEQSGTQVLFAFDHGYGGGLHVMPDGTALYCAWNTDNGGPMDIGAVQGVYAQLQGAYPAARVFASSFDGFYDAAKKAGFQGLPVVTEEIGDTWLYGVPSDPYKNTVFREMSVARRGCVEAGQCHPEDLDMRRFDRLLTKVPEHTWGADTTWYLGDYDNWTNTQLQAAIGAPNYQMTVDSWLDQRNYLASALQVLARANSSVYRRLAAQITTRLEQIKPWLPTPGSLRAAGFEAVPGPPSQQASERFRCNGWELGFGLDGSLAVLGSNGTQGPGLGGLGRYTYQSLSPEDFTAFDKDYGNPGCTPVSEDPGCHNFNKPNMSSARPEHTESSPGLLQLWSQLERGQSCDFWVQAGMPTEVHTHYGAPSHTWLHLTVRAQNSSAASVGLELQWFNKTATRLAEASWVSFAPAVPDYATGWRLHAFPSSEPRGSESGVDPSRVVAHGAVHLHSLGPLATVEYRDASQSIVISALDTPIVSAGLLTPFPTPSDNKTIGENLKAGMHWNLQNNIWNTNFPQWYPFVPQDAQARFRFQLEIAMTS